MKKAIFIGYDPREVDAFAVARHSARVQMPGVPIYGLVLEHLRDWGLYTRPTTIRDGRLFDVISDHPMATEFAISRFLTVNRAKRIGVDIALFVDADVLFHSQANEIWDYFDPTKAVQVVKHDHVPESLIKMDGQVQSRYACKNWSSVMLFNVNHPGHSDLSQDCINGVNGFLPRPGRDFHRFFWLDLEKDVGDLPDRFNYLVGHSRLTEQPSIIHYTDGVPSMKGYENCEYSDLWRWCLNDWAAKAS